MTIDTLPFDVAEYLDDEEAIAAYAEAVIDENDPQAYRKALDTIARSRGFTALAETTGIPRKTIIQALSGEVSGGLDTLRRVLVATSIGVGRVAAE